ncbi:peptide deformylase [Streptomyces sp. NPDC047071]|uniref:peptide deformylase n=1 Tax=Streptomyces sp. NPDC047071 TaxID=3154808 RepID=UPI00345536AD
MPGPSPLTHAAVKKDLARGKGEDGNALTLESQGRLARRFQREVDHINGTLCVDHFTPIRRAPAGSGR